MARCCASRVARCIPASRKPSKHNSPRSLRPSRSCWRVTALRLGWSQRLRAYGPKPGQRSVERSALVEAVEQLTRALNQIEALPIDPASRREQIKLQIALLTPLIHVKGYAAQETKAAVERAHLLIEQTEALDGTPEDPLLLFSVLYASSVAHQIAFNGDALRESCGAVPSPRREGTSHNTDHDWTSFDRQFVAADREHR